MFVATTSSYFYSKCLIFFLAPGFGKKKGIVGVKNVFGDFMTSLKSNPVISSAAIKNFGLDTEHYFDPPDLYEAKDIGMVSSS